MTQRNERGENAAHEQCQLGGMGQTLKGNIGIVVRGRSHEQP